MALTGRSLDGRGPNADNGVMRLSFALLFAAALWGMAAEVHAQCDPEPRPSASVRRVARRHYARGVRASQRGNWPEARSRFQQAYDTAPFAPIVYNLASSLEQIGELVEAAEMFREFLRRCDASENPQLQEDAEQLFDAFTRFQENAFVTGMLESTWLPSIFGARHKRKAVEAAPCLRYTTFRLF